MNAIQVVFDTIATPVAWLLFTQDALLISGALALALYALIVFGTVLENYCSTPTERSEAEEKRRSLWTVHGKRYDLSSFMDRHPGGPEALALGRGRDCTVLFETYHSL